MPQSPVRNTFRRYVRLPCEVVRDHDFKVIGEEPLMLDPSVRTRVRDVRFGPDGMIYVLSDTNSLFKITPKK